LAGIHVPVKDLPATLRAALKSVGYARQDIEVEGREAVSPAVAGGDGRRGFVTAVNFGTGKYDTRYGSWGGANLFERNLIDEVQEALPIPPNSAIIKGTEGYKGAFATVYVRPETLTPMLPAGPSDLTDLEKGVLLAFDQYTSAGRKDRRGQVGVSKWDAAASKLLQQGLLKSNAAGAVQITTAGKNAAENLGPGAYVEKFLPRW